MEKGRLLGLLCLMMSCLQLSAEPVTKSQAQEIAYGFLQKRMLPASQVSAKRQSPKSRKLSEAKELDGFYVFNVGEGGGFIIVSGDDTTEEILGYSDNGAFDESRMPENMRSWLANYSSEIDYVKALPAGALSSNVRKAPSTGVLPAKNPVAPLIQTKWNQSAPYNITCPLIDGERTLTGCVATSMAQLMYYHQWPKDSSTTVPGYKRSSLTLDELPPTVFEWDKMRLENSGSKAVYDECDSAVAKLMSYCGVSVQMGYGVSSSGASSANIATALRKYFGYDENVAYVERSNYTATEWEAIIYDELSNGRPTEYNGNSIASSGSHSFVCDGYDGNGFFHFNWGWGGYCDGYFKLSALTASTGSVDAAGYYSDGYSNNQAAIIGIQPPTADSEVNAVLVTRDLSTYSSYYLRNQATGEFPTMTIVHKVSNGGSGLRVSMRMGLGIFKGDELLEIPCEDSVSYINGTKSWSKFTINPSWEDGEYRIHGMRKDPKSGLWVKMSGFMTYYLDMKIQGDTVFFIAPEKDMKLKINSISVPTDRLAGHEQKVVVNITNESCDFDGVLYFQYGRKKLKAIRSFLSLKAGETGDVIYSFTPDSAGLYTLRSYKTIGNPLYTDTVEIFESSQMPANLSIVGHVEADEGKIYDSKLKLSMNVTNNDEKAYTRTLVAYIYRLVNGNRSYYSQGRVNSVVEPGETKRVDLTVQGIATGNTYVIYFMYLSNGGLVSLGSCGTGEYTTMPFYRYWTADGTEKGALLEDEIAIPEEAVAVDLRGKEASVVANDNPNCLYYLSDGAEMSAGLAGKNVVIGLQAGDIRLEDGYDYYVPIAFEASKVSYVRTFEKGVEAGNNAWSTIVLPFDVAEVTADGKQLDWFRSASENGKNFWLKEFYGEEGAKVYFSFADRFVANRPYIIAVPGNRWGKKWNLTNKEIAFSAENAAVAKTDRAVSEGLRYDFAGYVWAKAAEGVYALDDDGNAFVLGNRPVAPFRACFVPQKEAYTETKALQIASDPAEGYTTDMLLPTAETALTGGVYSIDGRRLLPLSEGEDVQAVLRRLPNGVYIIGGKKYVK